MKPPYGLVLTGGRSERMGRDKALLHYHAEPHARHLFGVLSHVCSEVYLSARAGQWAGTELEKIPSLPDRAEGLGPIGGILSAFAERPHGNWFVIACDFPFFDREAAETLCRQFDQNLAATCFRNSEGGFPEALCAIYTPAARALLEAAVAEGHRSPTKALLNASCKLVNPTHALSLANVNTPEERARVVQ